MYYLSRICSLCLAHSKNLKSQKSIDSKVREVLEYIISEEIPKGTPMQICEECLNSLNCIYKFRQRCQKNIITLNKYVQKLKQECGENKYLVVRLTDISQQETNDSHENNMHEPEESNFEIEFNGIFDNYNNSTYNERVEITIKCENTTDDLLMTSKVTEELTIKQESCSSESDLQGSCSSIPDFHNIEIHLVNEDDATLGIKEKDEQMNTYLSHDRYVPLFENLNSTLKDKRPHENQMRIKTSEQLFEKKHVCNVCQKTYKHRSHLNNHKRRVHSDLKPPHRCDICQKTFDWINNLKAHKRIHYGNQPYSCDLCKKTFNHNSSLNRHERSHKHYKNATDKRRKKKIQNDLVKIHSPTSPLRLLRNMCKRINP